MNPPDFSSMTICFIYLNEANECAQMLLNLANQNTYKVEHPVEIAYQIAFDLEENATQEFRNLIVADIKDSTTKLEEVEYFFFTL